MVCRERRSSDSVLSKLLSPFRIVVLSRTKTEKHLRLRQCPPPSLVSVQEQLHGGVEAALDIVNAADSLLAVNNVMSEF